VQAYENGFYSLTNRVTGHT